MESLKVLVQKYFPEETIVSEKLVKLRDTWIGKAGNVPLSATKFFYMKAVPLIETDKKYYFDKRVPLLYQSILSIVVGPFWLIVFWLVVQVLTHARFPIWWFIATFILGVSVGIINTLINKNSILNVIAIDKSWVSEKIDGFDEVTIKGFIPTGEASYFLFSHVEKEKLEQKILKILPKKMFYDLNFTIKYKEIK